MGRLILFNKPYGVVSQFTPEGRWRGLRDLLPLQGIRVAGRLDGDSEGLLVLTDDGALQHRIADPRHKLAKTYWAQVEGVPSDEAIARLAGGVVLADFTTQPCEVEPMAEPAALWPRTPPIRERRQIPTSWLRITLREGKNRQVRRMCAAVGHPVLRLIRYAVGGATLSGLAPGEWREELPGRLGLPAAGSKGRERGAARPVGGSSSPGEADSARPSFGSAAQPGSPTRPRRPLKGRPATGRPADGGIRTDGGRGGMKTRPGSVPIPAGNRGKGRP